MEARASSKANLPVLTAGSGGAAERFAHRMRGRHPAAVFFAAQRYFIQGLGALGSTTQK